MGIPAPHDRARYTVPPPVRGRGRGRGRGRANPNPNPSPNLTLTLTLARSPLRRHDFTDGRRHLPM